MKTFKLDSIVADGVGGPGAAAVSLIYAFLLCEYRQDFYHIHINQIDEGKDPEEIILKGPNNSIHINIKYPAQRNFASLSTDEQNQIRVDVAHTALVRLAEYDGKLDIPTLEAVRDRILSSGFRFIFKLKSLPRPKGGGMVAHIAVEPNCKQFFYYALLEHDGLEVARVQIYCGLPTTYYFPMFFNKLKWKNGRLCLTGKEMVIETVVEFDQATVNYVNLTAYPRPPIFELMRGDLTREERDRVHKDWVHSMPPSVVAIVMNQLN